MARKKPTRQARRRQSSPTLPWVWLLIGLSIGLFVTLLVWLDGQENRRVIDNPPRSQQPTAIINPPETKTEAAEDNGELKEKYGFYTDLPNAEVIAPVDEYRRKKDPVHVQEQKPWFSKGKYSLQAGAFKTKKSAEERRANLGLLGYESIVKKTKVNGKSLYRVILGPFPTLEETNKTKTQLHAKQITTFLVKDD